MAWFTLDYEHFMVHEGKSYTANYLETALANDATMRLRFTAGAKAAHLIIQFNGGGLGVFNSYAGTTYSADGTLPDGVKLTSFKRAAYNPDATATLRYAPTVNVLGAMRGNQVIPGGTGPQSTGAGTGSRIESIISPNVDILLTLTNKSGQPKHFGLVLDWYEVNA